MNDLLHNLPSDIREYIDCIIDDVIIFTPDLKIHIKVIKSFMLMLKKYGMLFGNQQDPYLHIQGEIYWVITVQQGQYTYYYTFFYNSERN